MASARHVARRLHGRKPKKWIQKTHMKKGALHRALGYAPRQPIPLAALKKAAKESGHIGKMARFALTLRKLPRHHGPRRKHK